MFRIIFVFPFSRISRPLTDLKKNKVFTWTSECQRVFLILKDKLINTLLLAVYSPLRENELHTDVSSKGFGSVLMQRQEDNKFHPVAYYSLLQPNISIIVSNWNPCNYIRLKTLSGIFGRNFVYYSKRSIKTQLFYLF